MITFPCRPLRVVLTTKLFHSFIPCHGTAKNKYVYQTCLLSSREQPLLGQAKESEKQVARRNYTSSCRAEISNTRLHARDSFRQDHERIQTVQNLRRWKGAKTKQSKLRQSERKSLKRPPSLVQVSQYSYRLSSGGDKVSSDISKLSSEKARKSRPAVNILQSMDASALLDPLSYCKGSTKFPRCMKRGSTSINGNDAARRLLKGREDFLTEARKLDNAPILLDGHGVPPALFQHCVDMADALLRYYGPDVVECSFNNYRSNDASISKEPHYVRVRRQNAKNSCMPPPSVVEIRKSYGNNCHEYDTNDEIDWNHNLILYLTVMERLANSLGQVIEVARFKKDILSCEKDDMNDLDDNDDDAFDSSSMQFLPLRPLWNVDILRGAYFDFEPISNEVGSTHNGDSNRIHPFPVVEFSQQESADSSGHVLIRLQGYPVANKEFDSIWTRQQQPVTLVFDACVRRDRDCC